MVPPLFEPDHLHQPGSLGTYSQPWCLVFLFLWFQDKPLTFVQRSILWSWTYMHRAYWNWLASSLYKLLLFEIFSFGFLWQNYFWVLRTWQHQMSAGFCVFNSIISLISVLFTSNWVRTFLPSALCLHKGYCKSVNVFDFCSLVYFKMAF